MMDIKTVLVSVAAATAASAVVAPMAATFVTLQASTPGSVETGHTNISGYSLAGRFGAGASPTLARVQVAELGSLQGVRANTSSGVSVFGANSAATGLGAGGYFTSASVGGRAMVAEQLSTTGNTVGGLFYNRSTTGGVALWGKHIGTSGTTTGVYGEVASTNGSALAVTNTASGTSVEAGTGSDSLLAHGKVPRYEYVTNTPGAMIPIAYGVVFTDGTKANAGTGNWTSSRSGVGLYNIAVPGTTLGQSTSVILCTSVGATSTEVCGVSSGASGTWDVGIHDHNGAATDSNFHFVIFKATGLGTMPPGLGDLKGQDEAQSPSLNKRRLAARQHQEAVSRTQKYAPPTDRNTPRP